jgi:hypothetical protein
MKNFLKDLLAGLFEALLILGIAAVTLGAIYVVGLLYAWSHGSIIITHLI